MPPQMQASNRPTNRRSTGAASIGRVEAMPIAVRGDSSRPPILLILFILALAFFPLLGGSKISLPQMPDLFAGGGSDSSYASQYRISSVNLASSGFKNQTLWQVSGRVMNETDNALRGPRLSVRLIRSDDSVAAEGEADLTGITIGPNAGQVFSAQLRTGAGETLRAVVTPVLPKEEAYDQP